MVVVKVSDIRAQIMALLADAETLITQFPVIVNTYLAVEADANITLDRASVRNTLTSYSEALRHMSNPTGGVYNKIHAIINTLSDV